MIGYDLDPEMIEKAEEYLDDEVFMQKRMQLFHENYYNIGY